MIFHFSGSMTGIAYLLLSLSLGFLAYRFFQYWQQKKDITSKCFFYFIASFLILALVRAVTGLFFVDNFNVLTATSSLTALCEAMAAAIVVYLIINLKFSGISPRLGFWLTFILGIIPIVINALFDTSKPYIEQSGAINWQLLPGIIPALYYIVRIIILLICFIPLIVILFQQAKNSNERNAKYRAVGLISVLFLAIIIGLIDFVFVKTIGVSAMNRDIIIGILSILIFVVVFLTQKPPEKNTSI